MKTHKTHWRLVELENFSRTLAQLLASGIPLLSALSLVQEWMGKKPEGFFAAHLRAKISRGESFGVAWAALTQEPLSSALISAAEASGQFQEMLFFIAQAAKNSQEFRKTFWQALRYPLFLLILSLFVLSFLCFWMIPKFASLYAGFHAKIPPLTQKILAFSYFLDSYGAWIFFSSLFLLVAALGFRQKIFVFARRHFPYFRELKALYFWQLVSRLLRAGILLDKAFEISIEMESDPKRAQAIRYLIRQLRRGERLSKTLKVLNIFSPKLSVVIGLAEESGQLTELLDRYLEQESLMLQQTMLSLKTWLEPIFLCVIGGVIGLVLVALYLPIIELGRSV